MEFAAVMRRAGLQVRSHKNDLRLGVDGIAHDR